MFSLKILQKSNFLQACKTNKIFSIILPKYNFARKVKSASNQKEDNDINEEILEGNKNSKTINVIRESVPIKISPYFGKAVSDKEKSASSINISQLVEMTGKTKNKAEDMTFEEKQEVIKTKQKLTAAKKQKARTIGVVLENIKRELPKEL